MSRLCILNAATYCTPPSPVLTLSQALTQKKRGVTHLNTFMQQNNAYLVMVRVCCVGIE